jgi:hypothetical protein
MPTTFTTPAVERSTYVLQASFADETGAAAVPNAGLTWTLLKKDGSVVNGRQNVAITSAASITIVLHGADLALTAGESKTRKLYIQGTYNSSIGSNLEIKDELTFSIVNLTGAI